MNILTLVVSALVFGIVILVHELGHYLVAKHNGIRVLEFSIGMGPAIWQTEKNGTNYSLRLLPVGGFVSMEGEDEDGELLEDCVRQPEKEKASEQSYGSVEQNIPFPLARPKKRIAVLLAGACMNFLLGFLALFVLLSSPDSVIASRQIGEVDETSLSAQSGLQVGDTIVKVNGHRCIVAGDIFYELSRTENHQASFVVRRNGETVQLPAVQFGTTTDDQGNQHMQLGFRVYSMHKNFITVTVEAARSTVYYGRIIYTGILDIFRGRASINDLSGPVGIVSTIGEAVSYGWQDVINILALITINLGIVNLLPLPALDGGKALLVLAEAILHRPVPTKWQMAINAAGMAMLFALMIFATWQDILRIF